MLGSNRLGVASVDACSVTDRLGAVEASMLDHDGTVLRWAATVLAGRDTPVEVERDLEVQLVGSAATARAASSKIAYEFCVACGRKGAYALRGGRGVRCKYCQLIAPVRPESSSLDLPA